MQAFDTLLLIDQGIRTDLDAGQSDIRAKQGQVAGGGHPHEALQYLESDRLRRQQVCVT